MDSERASSRRGDSALQRVLCRGLSPCTKTLSTTTTSSAVVSTSIPRLCLCGGRPPMALIDLLPKLVDRDFVPPRLQSMWVMTQEYPASPVHSASQSPCLDLDAISLKESDAKSGGALNVSPITVISVTRIRTCLRMIPRPVLRLHPVPLLHSTPGCVVVSPSHYPTPEEPVVSSAASSVISHPCLGRLRFGDFRGVSGFRDVSGYYGICADVSSWVAYGLFASSGSDVFSSGRSTFLGWFGCRVSVAPCARWYGACAGGGSC